PGWAGAHTGLGAALLENGQVEDAVAELQLARAAADPPKELWLVLTRALVARNLRLNESQRNWGAVEAALAQAPAVHPKSQEITLVEAQVLAARRDFAAARAALETARVDKGPGQALLFSALAELAEQQGKSAEADRILEQATAELGDHVEIRLARC